MTTSRKSGIAKKKVLHASEIAEIKQLVSLCDEFEHLRTPLNLDALHQRPGDEVNDFLYYEQNRLVGYVQVDNWGVKEKEGVALVHPDFRRRGIFRLLLQTAQDDFRSRGIERHILICEQASASGQAAMHAIGALCEFSEHEMVLETLVERGIIHPGLRVRPCVPADQQAVVSVLETDMEDPEAASQLVAYFFKKDGQQWYLALLDQTPIACLRVEFVGNKCYLYAFVVRPERRGYGYGRQMLEQVIRALSTAHPHTAILLQVETTNSPALKLYRSCGFQVVTTYDYYVRECGG